MVVAVCLFVCKVVMVGDSESGSCGKKIKLFSSWRSSSSWRVRIALNLKGIPYEYMAVNLGGGEQLTEEYTKINPLQYVPALVDDDFTVADSLAIILYLEDKYSECPLLPSDARLRALNLQVATCIASNIQPVQSGFVLRMIEKKLGPEERLNWARLFIEKGLNALENLLKERATKYCTGDQPALDLDLGKTIGRARECSGLYLLNSEDSPERHVLRAVSEADAFLVPQIASAKKFNVDMSKFPTLERINGRLLELPEVQAAAPQKQPDAPAS